MPPLQTGLAIVPYGIGLFLGPLITAPLVRSAAQAAGDRHGHPGDFLYRSLGFWWPWVSIGMPLSAAVLLAGFGQGVAFPRLFATVLGDVPPAQAGVAAGITNTALQIGAAVSVAAIGSLFFIGSWRPGHRQSAPMPTPSRSRNGPRQPDCLLPC